MNEQILHMIIVERHGPMLGFLDQGRPSKRVAKFKTIAGTCVDKSWPAAEFEYTYNINN